MNWNKLLLLLLPIPIISIVQTDLSDYQASPSPGPIRFITKSMYSNYDEIGPFLPAPKTRHFLAASYD